jgi:hypothetical protein
MVLVPQGGLLDELASSDGSQGWTMDTSSSCVLCFFYAYCFSFPISWFSALCNNLPATSLLIKAGLRLAKILASKII